MAVRRPPWSALLVGTVLCCRPAPAASMQLCEIDPTQSELVVQLFKAGPASALAHDHVVHATEYGGALRGDPADPARVTVVIDVKAASLRADEPALRRKYGLPDMSDKERGQVQSTMESEGQLDVAHHPALRFASKRVVEQGEGHYLVAGDLTIRDVTRPVELPVDVERAGNTVRARGTLRFQQSSFGYRPYSAFMGAVKNRDEVVLHVDVVTRPCRASPGS